MFSKYHYLNHSNMAGSYQFVAFYNNQPASFCSVITQPHPTAKNILRVHRLVTLPDYQGIGIGAKLLDFLGNYYVKLNKRFRIVTSTPSLTYSLNKNDNWILRFQGRQGKLSKTSGLRSAKYRNTNSKPPSSSANRLTTTWEYKNNERAVKNG